MPYAVNPTDDARIWYEVLGEGPPLVLHHGFSRSLLEWHPAYSEVLAQDFTVVMMDARGHGRSTKSYAGESYAMRNRVADVCAVLDAAGVAAAHYVGYSMGGQVGFGVARYAQSRLLSLTVGGMHPFPPESADDGRGAIADSLASGIEGHVARMEARMGTPLPEPYRSELLANDGRALAAIMSAPRDATLHAALAALDLPVLLYCGTQDGFRAGAERAAQAIVNARFVPLDGLDHLAAVLRVDVALPHIRGFLTEITAGGARA